MKRNITYTKSEKYMTVKPPIELEQLNRPQALNSVYFNDEERRIDYVLVFNMSKPDGRRNIFLDRLKQKGLEIEAAKSVVDPDIIFVKVHAPKAALRYYADKYDILVTYKQKTYIREPVPKFRCLRTELTSQDAMSPNYNRAENTFSGDKPTTYLSHERSLIVFNIMKRIPYGRNKFEVGLMRLVEKEIFTTAYPLHDGTFQWNDNLETPLNDRQLLARYWANWKMICKSQPLRVIGNYFGDNIALYYAWLNFYNRMLVFATIMGLVPPLYGWSTLSLINTVPIEEACSSNLPLCPPCSTCQMTILRDHCSDFKLTYIFDNAATFLFALGMSFWAAIYLVLWKRKQSVLEMRWNIRNSDFRGEDIRPEFENFAKRCRISELGELEHYIPIYVQAWRITLSVSVVIFMIALVVATVVGIILCEIAVVRRTNCNMCSTVLSAILHLFSIMILRKIYDYVVIWLTDLEVPKTQTDYDNSYTIKAFAFSFVNNYGALIYLIFIKGRLYSYPGDPNMYNTNPLLTYACNIAGCVSEMYIHLGIIMVFLPTLTNVYEVFLPALIEYLFRKKEQLAKITHERISRWEKDYELMETGNLALVLKYEEMVAQFGFVTLFAFAFPISPLLALINNLIKIQIDARENITCRRPQGRRTASIGAWMDIMKLFTYLSVFTNAAYITFASEFLENAFYFFLNTYQNYNVTDNYLSGYINFTLSEYRIDTSLWTNLNSTLNGTICWYLDSRNPPDHYLPYERSTTFYILLSMKFAFIILLEHLVLGITGLISYIIPGTPDAVREREATDAMELRRSRTMFSDININPEMSRRETL